MARKCASAAILETLRDPRVVTMAAAAQLLWIRVVTAMQNQNVAVLRFGSDIMSKTGIALFVQIAETEIETHLETLIDRGLLRRDDEGAVMCPMLAEAISRSEINRINGKKGGRPRKDRSPPGQTEMLMAIEGGSGETKITESETEMESKTGGNGVHSTYLLEESVSEASKFETEFRETGALVLEAMGIDPARSRLDYGLVRQWMKDGADREMILEVVIRRNKPGINTLKYFSAAIAEAIAAKPPAKPKYEREWEKAYYSWEISGRGVEPMPKLEDFKARFVA